MVTDFRTLSRYPLALDLDRLHEVNINTLSIKESVEKIKSTICMEYNDEQMLHQASGDLILLMQSVELSIFASLYDRIYLDLACERALSPVRTNLQNYLLESPFICKEDEISNAAVCVLPSQVATAAVIFRYSSDRVGYSSDSENEEDEIDVDGSYLRDEYWKPRLACMIISTLVDESLSHRLKQIRRAVADGAQEIDVLINMHLVRDGDWCAVYEELVVIRHTIGRNCMMKVVIEAHMLDSLDTIYRCALVAMYAGADYIVNSAVVVPMSNPCVLIMAICRAINEFNCKHDADVGFKFVCDFHSLVDLKQWIAVIRAVLGNQWIHRDRFRLTSRNPMYVIESDLFFCYNMRSPNEHEIFDKM